MLSVPGMYAIGTVVPMIGTVPVIARFYVRKIKKSKPGADDWTAFAGMFAMWAIAAVILAGTAKGLFGTHTLLDPETGHSTITWRERRNVQYQWVILILTVLAIGLVKLSVLFLYRRLFEISETFNVYSIALISLVVIWMLGFILAQSLICGTRLWAMWTSALAAITYCRDINGVSVALCLSDLLMDLMILLAPLPMIWRLQMGLAQKLQVTGVLALGFLSTGASAARAGIMIIDAYGTVLSYRDVLDENSRVVTWSMVEVAAALTGCSLPVLRPLFMSSSGSFFSRFYLALSSASRSKRSEEKGKANGARDLASLEEARCKESLGDSETQSGSSREKGF